MLKSGGGYEKQVEERRKKEQVRELNQVIAKFRALRTEGAGGDARNEVETLREELKETRRQRDQCMNRAEELKRENQELKKNQIESGGPAVVEYGSKRTKVRESTEQDEEVNKWKNIAKDCLEDGIPRGMTLEKAKYIKTLCDRLSEQEHWQKIINNNETVIDKLERLVKYFGYNPKSEDTDEMKKEANKYFKRLLEGEFSSGNFGNKAKSFSKNMRWVNELLKTKEEEEQTVGKKRTVVDLTLCRVCGKVGGRLLCEETPPHRVFCGLVCQSKFYYSSK